MADRLLEMRGITKRFPGVKALDDVSIELNKGEILAICGENGAGKSTLMKVLSGSYVSGTYDGEIWIDGKKIPNMDVNVARENGIEMIYQEINVFLDGTIQENLFVGNLPGKGAFVDYKKLYKDTQQILDDLEIEARPDSLCRPLSSGQLQMLAIMRAVIRKPKLLVLDEPTSALTDAEVEKLFVILRRLREEGVSSIYISHKLNEVFAIADRVTVIRDGCVISKNDIGNISYDDLVRDMVGREMSNMYPPSNYTKNDDIVLKVEHLSVPHPSIMDKNIVDDISFELHRGEILGFGGLVGAGRSEALGAVFGQYTKGITKEVEVFGKKVTIKNPRDAIKLGIGFVTEERKKNGFVWLFSIMQNLTLVHLPKLSKNIFIDRKYEREKAQEIFESMNVKAPNMETLIVNLSGGNQQKVVVGKWLLENPDILFVDEPTKGIDVGAKAEIYQIMRKLTAQGKSIIMASSDMPELVNVSDRVLVFGGGKIQGELVGEEITQEAVMHLAIN